MAPKQKQVPVEVEPAEQRTVFQLDPKALVRSLRKVFVVCSPADADFDIAKAADLLTRNTTLEVATSLAKWASGSETAQGLAVRMALEAAGFQWAPAEIKAGNVDAAKWAFPADFSSADLMSWLEGLNDVLNEFRKDASGATPQKAPVSITEPTTAAPAVTPGDLRSDPELQNMVNAAMAAQHVTPPSGQGASGTLPAVDFPVQSVGLTAPSAHAQLFAGPAPAVSGRGALDALLILPKPEQNTAFSVAADAAGTMTLSRPARMTSSRFNHWYMDVLYRAGPGDYQSQCLEHIKNHLDRVESTDWHTVY